MSHVQPHGSHEVVSWGSGISGLDTPGPPLVYRANRQIWGQDTVWSISVGCREAGEQVRLEGGPCPHRMHHPPEPKTELATGGMEEGSRRQHTPEEQ